MRRDALRSGRLAAGVVITAIAIGVAAPALAQTEPGTVPAGEEDKYVAGGDRPDLVMMYTGDVIGYLEDCGCKKNPAGGLTRRDWVVKRIQQRYPGVPMLLLDSGNFSDNPTPQGDFKTHTLLEAMDKLGYRVVNVGERDVRNGYDDFLRRTAGVPLRFISSNIVRSDTQQPVFEPRAVLELTEPGAERPIRVGVVGVARYNPVFLKQGPEGSNIVMAHHIESVQRQVAELQAEKVDVIVVLAALHLADAKSIAEQVPGIDYILGAYGGMFHEEDVGGTTVLFCGNRGQRIAEVRILVDRIPVTQSDIVRMHFMTRDYPESQAMRRFLDERTKAWAATGEGSPSPTVAGSSRADQ